MPKVPINSISSSIKNDLLSRLFNKMARIKDTRQMGDFLGDVLFESELVMIVRRLQIAKMLERGAQYSEIKRELEVGDSTIAEVRRNLETSSGGFKRFVKELW